MSRFDEISFGADTKETRRVSEWLETTCKKHGVPREEVDRLTLCLEEVVANIIAHGGQAARSEPVTVQLAVVESDKTVSVTVTDAGKAFNPVSAPTEKTPATLEEALPRGRGLGLIRQCSTSLDYRREDGRNHLTFRTRWTADSTHA